MNDFQPPARLRGIKQSVIRQIFERALPGSINLGLGEPDLQTPEVIRRAAQRIVAEEQNAYTSQAGLLRLRELIAGDYPFLENNPNRVIVTAGSQEALYLALLTLVDEGDQVLLPNPGFVAYPTIVQMAGGEPSFYRLPANSGFAFDIEDFRRALTPEIKVVVCVSPSNPTGRVLSKADLVAITEAIKQHGAYLISDEIYRELYYGESRPESASSFYDRTIVISGLSKSMSMTGWRLGWIAGDEAVVRSSLILHGYVTTCASTISQKAALVSWTDEAEQARSGFRKKFATRREHLIHQIETELELRAIPPEGAFYTMLDVRRFGSSMKVAEALLSEGVTTVPGGAFGNESEGFLRVSFCADLDVLTEGVRRMKEGMKKLGQ